MNAESKYSKKDFVPNGPVKWCAGCGDFSILAQTQKVLGETGRSPDEFAFISGIGCSSRFPYYVDTYGYHTIHGRALAIATGTKIANPDLSVWVAMGDGDGLAIGGNHFLHAVRRNVDMVAILMDNRIYGLTKGQFSPTSFRGQKTKTAPTGTVENPIDPVSLTLGLNGTFVARSSDRHIKHMHEMLTRAYQHKGFSLVHILQNCPIFNDGAFELATSKDTRDDNTVILEHGKPMLYGKEKDKCIVRDGFSPKVANVADVAENEILIHDDKDAGLGHFLAQMQGDDFPTPLGVFIERESPTIDQEYVSHENSEIERKGKGTIASLLNQGETWEV